MTSDRGSSRVVVKNIYHMLSYAFRTVGIGALRKLDTDDFENATDLLAAVLARGLEMHRRQGFERGYVGVSEELRGVRGRIDLCATSRLEARRSSRIACTYDEFTEDTPTNRVIRATVLRLVACSDVRLETRRSLRASLGLMANVGELENLRGVDWRVLQSGRPNAMSMLVLAVCRMVLEGRLLTEDAGCTSLADVFDGQKLHALYEAFLLAYFRLHHPELCPEAPFVDHAIVGERPSVLPRLKTDLVLSSASKTLIVDAKCYGKILSTHYESQILLPANCNQILSYVLHRAHEDRRAVAGMLLYAGTSGDGAIDVCWNDLGHDFYCRTLDLNCDFEQIREQLEAVASLL